MFTQYRAQYNAWLQRRQVEHEDIKLAAVFMLCHISLAVACLYLMYR